MSFEIVSKPMGNRPQSPSIHILDDDSLLNMFYHCRPVLLDDDKTDDDTRVLLGGEWGRERWWYTLTHVCRRWRELVLSSTTHLGLCLVCTYGTPVARMLAHSPPLPLIVDYVDQDRNITAQDEEGILIALWHRSRVRRIRLRLPPSDLRKLIGAIDEEFPVLEHLNLGATEFNLSLTFPQKFQAPRLRYLLLKAFAFPLATPLLTTAVDLVTLSLNSIPPLTYFHPNDLLQRLSLMRRLEVLGISFHSPVLDIDFEDQPLDNTSTTNITLPNLRWFGFQGTSTYLGALLSPMDTPLLEKLQITFFSEAIFVVPYLLQHMRTERFRFNNARFWFYEGGVAVWVSPHEGARTYSFCMHVICEPFDRQLSSMAQIFNVLRPLMSGVVHLIFQYEGHNLSSMGFHEGRCRRWRELLRSFGNVKTLRVPNGLIGELSRILDFGFDPTVEVLPKLEELVCPTRGSSGAAFSEYMRARNVAGTPVRLVRKNIPVNPPENLVDFPPSTSLRDRLGRFARLLP
jgi:hypothetical protein